MQVAKLSNVDLIADMLRAMYLELDPVDTIDDWELFRSLASNYIYTANVIFDHRGCFVMKEETPIVKRTPLWNGVAVYIKPEFRKTKALKEYYTYMFEHFKGSIMGFTEVNSEHNKVLLKRHKLLGYVYELHRS